MLAETLVATPAAAPAADLPQQVAGRYPDAVRVDDGGAIVDRAW